MEALTRQQQLEHEIDLRLLDVLVTAWEREDLSDLTPAQHEGMLRVLRFAYGAGYCDALREDSKGRRGELATKLGYQVPA